MGSSPFKGLDFASASVSSWMSFQPFRLLGFTGRDVRSMAENADDDAGAFLIGERVAKFQSPAILPHADGFRKRSIPLAAFDLLDICGNS